MASGILKCRVKGCSFLMHSDITERKRFDNRCCGICGQGAAHGLKCERRGVGLSTHRSRRQCAAPGCRLLVHAWPELGGFCCRPCFLGEGHGKLCDQIPAPSGSMKARRNDYPCTREDLERLKEERPRGCSQGARGAAEAPPLPAGAPAPAVAPPAARASPAATTLAAAFVAAGGTEVPVTLVEPEPGREVFAADEPGGTARDDEDSQLRSTQLEGSRPTDGWVESSASKAAAGIVAVVAAAERDNSDGGVEVEIAEAVPPGGASRELAQKVWIMAQGSSEEVLPAVYLGARLRGHSHRVRLLAPGRHRAPAEAQGLDFTELGIDADGRLREAAESLALQEWAPSGCREDLSRLLEEADLWGDACLQKSARAFVAALREERPDVVMATRPCFPLPFVAWRRHGVPVCRIDFCPSEIKPVADMLESWAPERAKVVKAETLANPLGGYLPEAYRKWLAEHKAILCDERLVDDLLPECPEAARGAVRRLCKGFQLPGAAAHGAYPMDVGDSRAALARVQAFLDAGKRPVCLAWGSVPLHVHFLVKFIAVFKATRQRAIVLDAWDGCLKEAVKDYISRRLPGDPDQLVAYAEEHVLFAGDAPRDWLLPRCACVAHHGGTETTMATLRAGVPAIVLPVIADMDHFGWADWVCRIGVGVRLDLFEDVELLEDPAWVSAVQTAISGKEVASKARHWGELLQQGSSPPAMVDFVQRAIELSRGPNASSVDEDSFPRFGW